MILRLPYGRDSLAADLRGLRCHPLEPSAPKAHHSAADLVAAALDHPLVGPPLAEVVRHGRNVTVLVPDASRKAWLPEVLPEVLRRILGAGLAPEDVTVLVACGSHAAVSSEDLAELLGPLPDGVKAAQHHARDGRTLLQAGSSRRGLEIRLHRAVLEADRVITLSAVQHHYFAGFGGGPKMIFPGVAGYEEIQANHAQVIDLSASPPRRHPSCEPGVLAGNPVAEEIAEAAALRPPDVALLMVAGHGGRPAWAAAGPLDATFPVACERVRSWYEVAAGPFSRMVISAGGHPSDRNLIQAHKALDAGCRFAAPGAEVLFVAECRDGAGAVDMAPFLGDPRPEAIVARLAERYVQYGHTTLRLVEKTSCFRVRAHTALPSELLARLGMTPVASLAEVLDRWREEEHGGVVGVMASGAVYPPSA